MEMEHATFVPVSPDRMTRALRAQATVAAAIPGWQPDNPEQPLPAGRLRLRIAGSTITYRGTLTVQAPPPAASASSPPLAAVFDAYGEEVRGTGTASARLAVTLEPATHPEPGTTVTFTGTARADGRLVAYEGAVVDAALRRLLDRFCAQLAESAPEESDAPDGGAPAVTVDGETPAEAETVTDAGDGEGDTAGDETAAGEEAAARDDAAHDGTADDSDADDGDADGDAADDDTADDGDAADEIGDLDDIELVEVEVEVPESAAALDDLVPPAEAAHARRTMIGRSAEEVDHAPPRGRYAPEPAPDAASAAATLRWAAPAAAALLASAVVVGRVLRRRR